MYLQAVTICVNYSDFLAQTIAHNKQLFDHWIIVTTPEDIATQKLCQHYNVECLKTNEFTKHGDVFNKARGINVALDYMSKHDWVLHIDADMYLPPLTRGILERISLDKKNIYGIDRMMCPNFEAWQKYITNPEPTHSGWVYIHGNAFPFGVRIGEYMSNGYEPIGFFQLWNPNGSGVYRYPDTHGAADRTDVQFAKKWERSNRALIPEVIGIHLDSENSTVEEMGKNWNGRKTKVFGYTPQDKPKQKKKCCNWFTINKNSC
jgi:hypothetical protein